MCLTTNLYLSALLPRGHLPHSSSHTNDVLKVRSVFKLLQDDSPWASLLNYSWNRKHGWDPTAAAHWCPDSLADGHWSSLSFCNLETDVLRVSCIAAFFLTVKPTSSFCPLFKGQGFLQVPQSTIITNLPGPLLHRYALDTQNAIWLKGSLPGTCVAWFGCVAGVFRFVFIFFFFGEAVLMKWKQNQIVGCANGEK